MVFQKANQRNPRMSGLCPLGARDIFTLLTIFGLLMLNVGCGARYGGGPVPTGEWISLNKTDEQGQVELVALTGKIEDQAGNPIAEAYVGARQSETERFLIGTVTNESGQFRFRLPPGTYKIESSVAGFSLKTSEVTLKYGSQQNLEIKLASIVPIGEPVPGPVPITEPSVGVLEISPADQAGLLEWLKEQMPEKTIAVNIIPLEEGKSLCCLKAGTPMSYRVITVDGNLTTEKIREYINNNKDKSFVGVHRLKDKFLIIFRDGK